MIIFYNQGSLDLDFISTFGASVKSEGAIGYFGTGLKFAIATLLRHKQEVTLVTGGETYKFHTETKSLRGQDFEIVYMNGTALGFTTELGKDWEMWMAFRELYCNALDEGGGVIESETLPDAETMFIVSGDLITAEFHAKSDNFILPGRVPLYSDSNIEVYEGESPYLFYRGVRIHKLNHRSIFTYNLKAKIDLTEDRTLKYYWEPDSQVARLLQNIPKEKFQNELMLMREGCYEFHLPFHARHSICEEFKQAALNKFHTASEYMPESLKDIVRKAFPELMYIPVEISSVQQTMLNRACAWAKFIGFDPEAYPIIVVDSLGGSILALADREHKKIIITKTLFGKGTKYLCLGLIEETIHLKENLDDETRGLQTFLFEKILTMAEELKGEPI